MDYGYLSQKLNEARRALMLPHLSGEADSILSAFHTLHLALKDMNESGLEDEKDDNALEALTWLRKLKELMYGTRLVDQDSVTHFTIKAQQLGNPEKFELSRCVDNLAYWIRQMQ